MRLAFILSPLLVPAFLLACAPAAMAGPCSSICKNPAYHSAPVYKPAPASWRKADHTHVTVHNGAAQVRPVTSQAGVRVLAPAPLYNPQQQANLAGRIKRNQQAQAQLETARTQAALRASQALAQDARLSAIEAKQDLILERQKRAMQPRRRVFYGNNRFFGRNGFIGNSNFNGGTVPSNRKRRRRAHP